MYYHVRITQKSNRKHDEVKLDLSEEQLLNQFIEPYNRGDPIVVNGKTIPLNDLDRIRVNITRNDASANRPIVERELRESSVMVIGGPSVSWYIAGKGEDVTDKYIQGPPGGARNQVTFPQPESREIVRSDTPSYSNRVFIVHGHDHALKNDLEVFLRRVGLEPIILHREADEGLTIIEKFEKHSDVGYAFILVTPDDIGCTVSEYAKAEAERKVDFRTRQNVIWEWGYFVGALSRGRVCCIYRSGVTLPSDLSGLIWKEVKESIEEIGYKLMLELQAAGYDLIFS